MTRNLCLLAIFMVAFLAPLAQSSSLANESWKVRFFDYGDKALSKAATDNKPLFVLFSVEWCPWCEMFEQKTLSDPRVYNYLNKHFINIFINADLRSDLKAKFNVTTLPYVAFLRPDGDIFFKYGGALYPDDFLGLIMEMKDDIAKDSSSASQTGPTLNDPPQQPRSTLRRIAP